MSDWQLAFIETLAETAPLHRFLEVGVYKGVTTTLLSEVGPVVAADTFEGNPEFGVAPNPYNEADVRDRRDGFLDSIHRFGKRENVTVLTGKSQDVLPLLANDRFGLILIDANHEFLHVLNDIHGAWPLLVPEGVLALDDFSSAPVGGKSTDDVSRAWSTFVSDRLGGRSPALLTADSVSQPPKLVAVRKPA